MINLYLVYARVREIADELPVLPHPEIPTGTTPDQIYDYLMRIDRRERARIDALVKRLVLDLHHLDETEETWFLIAQRARGAVYFLEHTLRTLDDERELVLSKATLDHGVEWAMVSLWQFSGPMWCQRSARLLAAGMDLSSRESPPSD